jgi:uncharacterized peroxidase-related enzyme
MTELTIHTTTSAPDGARDALAHLEQTIGFVPNLAATMAGSPVAIEDFVGMQSALRASALTPVEREVVGLTVSLESTCEYSMAAHSTFAQKLGAPDDVVAALRTGAPLPDSRLEALHAFVLAVVRERGHVADGETRALLDAGFSTEQLLEVLTQVAYTTLANLVANLAGTPIDAAFEHQRWVAAV